MVNTLFFVVLTLLATCLATSHGNIIDALSQQYSLTSPHQEARVKRVSIIGAGPAGTSSAYHLHRFAAVAGIPLNVTVFEKSSYIGGRSTTVNVWDDPDQPVELGASIFVELNRILVDAAREFELNITSKEEKGEGHGDRGAGQKREEEETVLGIWNGREFVVQMNIDGGRWWKSWWSTAKLLWRYGFAPITTKRLMREVTGRFAKMYESPFFPYRSLTQVARLLDLTEVTGVTGETFLREKGVGEMFARELVQASTRVNYAQNLGEIHGLEALVCMATDGAMSVKGGNWKIFDGMVRAAGAGVRLQRSVVGLEIRSGEGEGGGYVVRTKRSNRTEDLDGDEARSRDDPEEKEHFDTVILAAPYQSASISINPAPRSIPSPIPYVNLHVTLFSTPHVLSPSYFNLTTPVPEFILTTLQADENASSGVGSSEFFSVNLLRTIVNPKTGGEEGLYKIFSPREVDEGLLGRLLGIREKEMCGAGKEKEGKEVWEEKTGVSWIYRKIWQSYPYLPPRTEFEELQLDEGLWYTSGIESFISTMETSALSGMNVARLIVDGWVEKEKRSI